MQAFKSPSISEFGYSQIAHKEPLKYQNNRNVNRSAVNRTISSPRISNLQTSLPQFTMVKNVGDIL